MGSQAAATVLQGAGASFMAFEAEVANVIAGTPENWIVKSDSTASGGKTLIVDGTNSTGDSPHSFAHFRLKFANPGTYYIYYRWQAEPARTANDVFTGNSIWIANRFGAFSTKGLDAQVDYIRSDSNNLNAPDNSVYTWRRDVDTLVYTVTEADIAGGPVVLTMGTREAGFTLDRIILSTEPALTPATLDAMLNSNTDLIVQVSGDSFVAWEAEVKAKLIAGTPENWVFKSDAAASGGATLIIAGANSTGDSPHSFAQFSIQFATPGTYYIYYRWQAEPARTANDVFTGNSIWIANRFGAFSTTGLDAQVDYIRSDSNNLNAPDNSVYTWRRDVDTLVYTVTAAEIDGGPVVLTVGTREAGFTLDRIVLSTEPALTAAALDALLNSGARPVAPEVKSAVGSASLNTLRLLFTRPLDASTVNLSKFNVSPSLALSAVAVNVDDPRIVDLTTAAQTQGTKYTVNVTGVKDTTGTESLAGANGKFTAWKKVNGWATKEVFFGITGPSVDDILASPKYIAGTPDRLEFVRGFQLNQDPLTDNYGARLSAFFTPAVTAAYDFFPYNDDEAELQLSTDATAANLSPIGRFPLLAAYDSAVFASSPSLSVNQSYLLVGLLKQVGGAVYLNVAARRSGDATSVTSALELAGNRISTFVNPDLGVVTFAQQPTNATAAAGARATFRIRANTLARPVYYQWQKDGVDIPGAVRPVYITPVLSTADSGPSYRCVVSVAGTDTASNAATLTVGPGSPALIQPYVGISFVGGGTAGGGTLLTQDVAGVVRQENWNNVTGFSFDSVPLVDAAGAASPVTLSGAGATEVWYTGTISTLEADGVLLQGFVNAISSLEPVTFTLNNVPTGNYNLLVYSVGFDFAADYKEAFGLVGSTTYPTLHVRAETGLPYNNSPAFRRASSTDPANRQSGNYVEFNNVSPATDGTLTLSVTWESDQVGNTHQPAVNAIQLVRVNTEIRLTVGRSGDQLEIQYPEGTLETTTTVNGGWASVPGAAAPSYKFTPSGTGSHFFRVRK